LNAIERAEAFHETNVCHVAHTLTDESVENNPEKGLTLQIERSVSEPGRGESEAHCYEPSSTTKKTEHEVCELYAGTCLN
jgi:hypothetical protein